MQSHGEDVRDAGVLGHHRGWRGIAGLFYRLDTRIDRLDSHVRAQGERLARLEGKVDTLTGSVEALIAAFAKPSGETT